MIQPISHETQAAGAPMTLSGQSLSVRNMASVGMGNTAPLLTREAALKLTGPEPTGTVLRPSRVVNLPQQRPPIAIEDWDALFCAVQTQLKHAVGERLGILPYMPTHSIDLAATLVQAIVLDCVDAMEQLHAALKQERSQRPTD
ncbi:hypothetical protein [Polaromonas sp.]|uniref:hypothetical protein n=1 Tax=Polaromonas sp. TaxID=1869339 RepID=UPI003CADEF70